MGEHLLPIVLAHWPAWGKGVGKARPDPTHPVIPTPGPNVRVLGVNWYYDWSHANEPLRDAHFMPMIWCGIKPSDGLDMAPFDRYAEIYDFIKSLDPTAKVFCCGNFFASNTTWWSEFRSKLRGRHPSAKLDGVAMHAYPWSVSTGCALDVQAEDAWICLRRVLEGFVQIHQAELSRPDSVLAPDAPLWLTEYGYLVYNGPPRPAPTPTGLAEHEVVQYLMEPLVGWLQSGSAGYQAVAWYVTIDEDSYTAAETNLFEVVNSYYVLADPVGRVWATVVPVTVTP